MNITPGDIVSEAQNAAHTAEHYLPRPGDIKTEDNGGSLDNTPRPLPFVTTPAVEATPEQTLPPVTEPGTVTPPPIVSDVDDGAELADCTLEELRELLSYVTGLIAAHPDNQPVTDQADAESDPATPEPERVPVQQRPGYCNA